MGDFAQKAYAAGYRAAAMELDDFGNAARWTEFRDACFAHGIRAGVWFTNGGNIASSPSDAAFAISELEGPGDYLGIMNALGSLPDCPRAVITNFNAPLVDANGIPQPEAARPLIDADFWCLTEAYMGDNPNATPDNLAFRASQLGWKTAQPVYGVYNAPLPANAAGGYGVYLAEYLF